MIEPLPEKDPVPSQPPAPVPSPKSNLSDQYDSEVLDYINGCLDQGVATEAIAKKLSAHDFSEKEVKALVSEIMAGRNRVSDRYDPEVLDYVHQCLDKGWSTNEIVLGLGEHDFTPTESRELVAELTASRKKKGFSRKPKSSGGGIGAHESSDMTSADWIIAVLCSGIGCIVGIVRLAQGRPNGPKMFLISLAFSVFWSLIRLIMTLGRF